MSPGAWPRCTSVLRPCRGTPHVQLRQIAELCQGEGCPLELCSPASFRFLPSRAANLGGSYGPLQPVSNRSSSSPPFPSQQEAHLPCLHLSLSLIQDWTPKGPCKPCLLDQLEVGATNDHSFLFKSFVSLFLLSSSSYERYLGVWERALK